MEIANLPNSLLIQLLEWVTSWWLTITKISPTGWLIGFPERMTWFLIVICLLTLLVLQTKKLQNPTIRLSCFALLLGGAFLGRHFFVPQEYHHNLLCHNGNLSIDFQQKHLTIIDPGAIGRRSSADDWITYTLLPHLLKKTGQQKIDEIIILKINQTTLKAMTTLCTLTKIKKVVLPAWQGTMPDSLNKAFIALKDTAHQHGTELLFIKDQPITIGYNHHLICKPKGTIKKKGIVFRRFMVCDKK